MAGKLLKCPGCGKGVRVPGGPAAPPKPAVQDDWIDITEEYVPPGGAPAAGGPTGNWGQALLQKHDLPEKMQEDIRSMLTQDEQLLWCDRPQMDILMARARKQQLLGICMIPVVTLLLGGLAFFLFSQVKDTGAMIGAGVVLFMMLAFDALGVFIIFTPGRVRRGAGGRSCYVLSNRRLLVHPGSGTQTFMNQGGNQAAVVVGTEQFGVSSYTGLELQRMIRIEEKNFPGSGRWYSASTSSTTPVEAV